MMMMMIRLSLASFPYMYYIRRFSRSHASVAAKTAKDYHLSALCLARKDRREYVSTIVCLFFIWSKITKFTSHIVISQRYLLSRKLE